MTTSILPNTATPIGLFEHRLNELPLKAVIGIAVLIRDLRNKQMASRGLLDAMIEGNVWERHHPVAGLGVSQLTGIMGIIISLFGDFISVEDAHELFLRKNIVV